MSLYTLWCFLFYTQLFQHPNFQTPSGTTGFSPGGNQYIYGHLKPPEPWSQQQLKTFVFLGDTLINEPGQPMNNNPSKLNWGNIFNYEYFQMHLPTYVGTETLEQAKKQ